MQPLNSRYQSDIDTHFHPAALSTSAIMTLPVPNATQPFWRNQPHALDNHRSTEDLPTEADIVIVGAGYAGASIAYHLLEQTKNGSKKPSIVILEAREACSGATGRNGTPPNVDHEPETVF
jgi:uncharacterized protein with NAD-binding domain and iron-sulfur cluster